jgi:hypothetical protein
MFCQFDSGQLLFNNFATTAFPSTRCICTSQYCHIKYCIDWSCSLIGKTRCFSNVCQFDSGQLLLNGLSKLLCQHYHLNNTRCRTGSIMMHCTPQQLAHNQTSARLDLNVQTAVHSCILLCSLRRSANYRAYSSAEISFHYLLHEHNVSAPQLICHC